MESKRVTAVKEQAAALRSLAESFDLPQIKEELLFLAERCDRLAVLITRELWERMRQPIGGKRDSG